MRIQFTGITNKDYCRVNVAKFHLKDGGTITIDRNETCFTIENRQLTMEWSGIYIWDVNEWNIFDQIIEPSENLIFLLKGSWVELELDSDADLDYEITNIRWIISGDNGLIAEGNEFICGCWIY